MTPQEEQEMQELKQRLFIPNQCPSQWTWAQFCAEGRSISFGTHGNKVIELEFGFFRLDFIRNNFFIPYRGNHFIRITKLAEEVDGGVEGGFVGYLNPIKRRAVFALGQTEPRGLFLFFLWHSLYDQKLSNLLDFFELFLGPKKEASSKEYFSAVLDFDDFLKIRSLIGDDYREDEVFQLGCDMVEGFRTAIRQRAGDAPSGCDCPGVCQCPSAERNRYRNNILGKINKMDDYVRQLSKNTDTSDRFKLLLDLKVDIGNTL